MTIEEKQRELDVAKWNKSQSLRLDACGTFNYCANCNKGIKNPCAVAYSKTFNENLEGKVEELVAEEPTKKSTAKKATSEKKTTAKKPATKTTTKKATTKSTTTKKTTTKKTTK